MMELKTKQKISFSCFRILFRHLDEYGGENATVTRAMVKNLFRSLDSFLALHGMRLAPERARGIKKHIGAFARCVMKYEGVVYLCNDKAVPCYEAKKLLRNLLGEDFHNEQLYAAHRDLKNKEMGEIILDTEVSLKAKKMEEDKEKHLEQEKMLFTLLRSYMQKNNVNYGQMKLTPYQKDYLAKYPRTIIEYPLLNVVFRIIKEHPMVKQPAICGFIYKSATTVKQYIKKLKAMHRIKHVGSPKYGGYVVIER